MASSRYTFKKHYANFMRAPSQTTTKSSFRTCSISDHRKAPDSLSISRRYFTSVSLGVTLLFKVFDLSSSASAVEFRLTAPDQSPEEANTKVRLHAGNLLKIKPFLDLKSWKEAQTALGESSAKLKQDLYTIIQTKPPSERRELRRLYTDLFNIVTNLEYAARDKDENQVQECYDNIVGALDKIFARI